MVGRNSSLKIGVLALQGDVPEHIKALQGCGCSPSEVKSPPDLEGLQGLILPGGESTTQGKLLVNFGLLEPITQAAHRGLPLWGTCAGMILMAKEIVGSEQPLLGVMDVVVRRNAFGRQVDSFESPLVVKGLPGGPFRGVFIRAPYVDSVGPQVEVLSEFEGRPVFVRQGHLLASAFHPELTDDLRIHEYFLSIAAGKD